MKRNFVFLVLNQKSCNHINAIFVSCQQPCDKNIVFFNKNTQNSGYVFVDKEKYVLHCESIMVKYRLMFNN